MTKPSADLRLAHPPGFYDFPNRGDIYWPFMSSGGSELITPLYEVFPVSFKPLKRYLEERDHHVQLLHLSTLLLLHPTLDLERVFEDIDVEVVGRDLHRMTAELGDAILSRNALLYADKVINQSFPVPRSIGGRWYDEVPRSADWISQRTREEPRTERAIA